MGQKLLHLLVVLSFVASMVGVAVPTVTPGQLQAATPPTVTTDPATSITSNSATLNGSLTSLGTAANVTVSFEWGPTTSYGNITPPLSMVSAGTFSFALSGLSSNTTYHFRAKAVGDGTGYGADMTFTTTFAPTLVSIVVTPVNPTIAVGQTLQFTATAIYSDNSTIDVTTNSGWLSSNTTVAVIGFRTGLAQGLASGTTVISANTTGNTTLTVTSAVLNAIAVTPANPIIALGQTQQFSAIGIYSDNSTANITASVTWTSSNATVATIGATGLAQSVGAGTTIITATLSGISGSTTLTVSPVAPPPSPLSRAMFTVNAQHQYFSSDNAVGNTPLDFRLDWWLMFLNQDLAQNVSHVTLSADASSVGPITGTDPPATVSGSTYTWGFDNVLPYDGTVHNNDPRAAKRGRLLEGKIVNLTPGFTSSRQVDQEVFDAPSTQTVTVRVTPQESCNLIRVVVEPSGPGETDLVRWEAVGAYAQSTSNITVGQTYTYQFTLNVTPKAGTVRFLPMVSVSCTKNQSSTQYSNTTNVSAQASDTSGRTLPGTAITSQVVTAFTAQGRDARMISYNRVSTPAAPLPPPTNDVGLTFTTGPVHAITGDSVENIPLAASNKMASSRIENTDDVSNEAVNAPVLTFTPAAGVVVLSVDQENLVSTNVSPYTWNLPNIAEGEWQIRSARTTADNFTFTPGFSASRALDKTLFTASGSQKLTITAIPQESMYRLAFIVRIMGATFVDATITSPASGPGISLTPDGKRLDITVDNVTAGTPYTREVTIQVNLKPGVTSATYKPMVSVSARQFVASGDVAGTTVSRATALGTLKWQTADRYSWHWLEQTAKSVSFQEVQTGVGAIEMFIQAGLTWLVGQQQADGCWSPGYEPVAHTAFAVVKLEDRAFELGYKGPFDPAYPYKGNVEKGLNYIFSNAAASGVGICFAPGHHETYSTGIAMMAIAASRDPNRLVSTGPCAGQTYKWVLQKNVDYFAWGQCDAPSSGRGGWLYGPNQWGADNSNTGFAVLGLRYAEADLYGFKCTIPPALKSEHSIWIDYIQNDPGPADDYWQDRPDGGSGYSSPTSWCNLLKTGNLLFEMAFVGDTTATPRVQQAIGYIQNHWRDPNGDPGWQDNLHSMYCLMKGFQSLGIDTITVGGSPVNWFDEISTAIVGHQASGGYWDWGGWGRTLNTEFALLTLEKVAPPPPVNVVVDVPGCACDVTGYQVKVTYTVERFLVNGTLKVSKDGNPVDTVNLTNFTGTATYTRNVASDTPGTHTWKAVLDVTPVGGGTPGHAEGTDSVKVCESPKVAGIPDQTVPFHTFDLDNYLTYGGGLPVTWSASAPPPGWTVTIDGNNVVTVTAPAGARTPAIITFSARVTCPPCGIICEGSDDAVFVPNQPPDTSKAYAVPGCLWPPNHEFVNISIMGVTDPDGDPVTITITKITSDEPTASDEGSGGAKHVPDATGVGTGTASVRAERSGDGDGRVYVISFTASDGKGGVSQGTVTVKVPHDQSSKDCTAIDNGQKYDATQIN